MSNSNGQSSAYNNHNLNVTNSANNYRTTLPPLSSIAAANNSYSSEIQTLSQASPLSHSVRPELHTANADLHSVPTPSTSNTMYSSMSGGVKRAFDEFVTLDDGDGEAIGSLATNGQPAGETTGTGEGEDSRVPYAAEEKGGNGRYLKQTKRAAQNRTAQQAFRKRKEERTKELEDKEKLLTQYQEKEQELVRREQDLLEREARLAQSQAANATSGSSTTTASTSTFPAQVSIPVKPHSASNAGTVDSSAQHQLLTESPDYPRLLAEKEARIAQCMKHIDLIEAKNARYWQALHNNAIPIPD
ncbi:hypothetical protein EMMF5_002958 [Cystobasidiomycetes sp. EMM_F5]